jgi:hypothetical protein
MDVFVVMTASENELWQPPPIRVACGLQLDEDAVQATAVP